MSDIKKHNSCCNVRPVFGGCSNLTFEEVKSLEKLFEEFWWMGTPVPKPIVVLGSVESLKKPCASDFVLKASSEAFKPEKLETHQIKFKLSN